MPYLFAGDETRRQERNRPKAREIEIIGAPVNFGQEKPGVDLGPYAIRYPDSDPKEWLVTRLRNLGHSVGDYGGEDIPIKEPYRERLIPPGPTEDRVGHHLPEVVESSKILAEKVKSAADRGRFPLVLGGDHSVGIGSIAGISAHHRDKGERIGLIWVDAHADMNTAESSWSHHIHGMPLASCIGWGTPELTELFGFKPKIDPSNVVLIGIRDVDLYPEDAAARDDMRADEARLVRDSGIRYCTMREIDEHGIQAVMAEAIKWASNGTAGYHVSFDMDFVDPSEAPGVGTSVKGGGTFREAHLIMETICDSGKLTSLDVVEVNPFLDDRNRTAKLARHLIESAMGKSIL